MSRTQGSFPFYTKPPGKMPFDEKLKYTRELIHCWVESWGLDSVYIAFSGGLDSTVLLHIARSLYPEMKAAFNQTGQELPEIVQFVKTFENVDILRPRMPFHKVIKKYGWPVVSKEQSQFIYQYRTAKSEKTKQLRLHGRLSGPNKGRSKISECWKYLIDAPFLISDECCNKLKKEPSKRYEKQTGRNPILGTMASESQLRKQRAATCNLYDGTKRPISKPLTWWRKKDVWEYIGKYKIPYCSVYDNGWDRTGCVFCMYGIYLDHPNRFQIIKKTHPALYDFIINELEAGPVLDFMGIPYK